LTSFPLSCGKKVKQQAILWKIWWSCGWPDFFRGSSRKIV